MCSDYFNNHVSTSDKCQICKEIENAEHFCSNVEDIIITV